MPEESNSKKSSPGWKELFKISAVCCGWLIVLALFIWSCVEYGQFSHSKQDHCTKRTQGYTTGFDGDEDFYGFGIRLGIYLQWLASLIATGLLGFERRTLTTAYLGAQIAMLAAFLALMFRNACVFTAEAIVILYFLLGGISSVLGPDLVAGLIGGRDTRLLRRLDFAIVFLVSLIATIASWFWIRLAIVGDGFDFMSTPGGTSIFLIDQVHVDELKVASAIMAIICLYLAVCTFEKAVWLVVTRMKFFPKDLIWEPPSLIIASSVLTLDMLAGFLVPNFLRDILVPNFSRDWAHSFFKWNGFKQFQQDVEDMLKDENTSGNNQEVETPPAPTSATEPRSLLDALRDRKILQNNRYIYGFVVKM